MNTKSFAVSYIWTYNLHYKRGGQNISRYASGRQAFSKHWKYCY